MQIKKTESKQHCNGKISEIEKKQKIEFKEVKFENSLIENYILSG